MTNKKRRAHAARQLRHLLGTEFVETKKAIRCVEQQEWLTGAETEIIVAPLVGGGAEITGPKGSVIVNSLGFPNTKTFRL